MMFYPTKVKIWGPLLFVAVQLVSAPSGFAQPEAVPPAPPPEEPTPTPLSEEVPAPATAEMEYEAEAVELIEPLPTPTPRTGPTFEEMIEQRRVAYAQVLTVLSGDTYRLVNGYRVKLLGVDSPPVPLEEQESSSYGLQAFEYAQQLLRGRLVKLGFDQRRKREDGTLLAYLFLPDGTLVNEDILLEGLARFDPAQEIDEKMAGRFQKAQTQAQRFHRGIWKRLETPPPLRAEIPLLPLDATPEAPLPIEPPVVLPPPTLPDQLILVTGEVLEGKIVGDPESPFVTLETAEGNVIAIPQRRISEIKRQ